MRNRDHRAPFGARSSAPITATRSEQDGAAQPGLIARLVRDVNDPEFWCLCTIGLLCVLFTLIETLQTP